MDMPDRVDEVDLEPDKAVEFELEEAGQDVLVVQHYF